MHGITTFLVPDSESLGATHSAGGDITSVTGSATHPKHTVTIWQSVLATHYIQNNTVKGKFVRFKN
jgi:hypothetical protein